MPEPNLTAWLTGTVFKTAFRESISRILKLRAEAAREILREELAKGDTNLADAADRDEAAAMIFEFAEAAQQGSARRNLRMLAQILAGALTTPPVYASEFLAWSRILADLTSEELIVLARLHQTSVMPKFQTQPIQDYNGMKGHLQEWLLRDGIISEVIEMNGILAALQRTGLVIYSAGGYGGSHYLATPKLAKLMKMVRMEEVLAERDR